MKRFRIGLGAALAAAVATQVVVAHHSFSMFDSTREEVLVGDVVRWTFNSPHTVLYLRDAKGTVWGFEGAAPPAIIGRTPKVDGLTFKPGDRITMIHCPLHDGRSGGAIGLIITKDGTWYNPADGGCRANEANWRKWLDAGHTSKAEADAGAKK
jgi:hypothetical protein